MSIRAERPRFEMVPHWVLNHPDLTPRALQVYLFLRRFADVETGEAWPSRKRLALACGIALSTLDEALSLLREIGAVEIHLRKQDGSYTTNLYVVRFYEGKEGSPVNRETPPPVSGETLPRSTGRGSTGESVIEQDPMNKTHRTRQRPMPTAVAVSDGFDEFWDAFGYKNGKAAARKAWAKAIKRAEPSTIIAGAERYRAWLDSHPNPPQQKWAQGWLNDSRWEDELPAPRVVHKATRQDRKRQQDAATYERLRRQERKEVGS